MNSNEIKRRMLMLLSEHRGIKTAHFNDYLEAYARAIRQETKDNLFTDWQKMFDSAVNEVEQRRVQRVLFK